MNDPSPFGKKLDPGPFGKKRFAQPVHSAAVGGSTLAVALFYAATCCAAVEGRFDIEQRAGKGQAITPAAEPPASGDEPDARSLKPVAMRRWVPLALCHNMASQGSDMCDYAAGPGNAAAAPGDASKPYGPEN